MDTLQLLKALPCTDISVGGIYLANKLPVIWPRSCAIIANKANNFQPGSHWVPLHVERTCYGIYFDGLRCKPTDTNLTYALKRNSVIYEYNDRRPQDHASNLCGNYCMLVYISLPMADVFQVSNNYSQTIINKTIDILCHLTRKY